MKVKRHDNRHKQYKSCVHICTVTVHINTKIDKHTKQALLLTHIHNHTLSLETWCHNLVSLPEDADRVLIAELLEILWDGVIAAVLQIRPDDVFL